MFIIHAIMLRHLVSVIHAIMLRHLVSVIHAIMLRHLDHQCVHIWVPFVTCIPNEGRRLAGEKGGVIKILASVEQNP